MKAVGLYEFLPSTRDDALVDLEIDAPVAAGRDLLVRVQAISVNPVDTKMRIRGNAAERLPEPKILGFDAAGVVEAVGEKVTRFKRGERVFYAGSSIRQGANAELHRVDERIVGHMPTSLDFAHAAALPLTALTAWEALFTRCAVNLNGGHVGRSVLILGGAGGVGSIAIQLAKKLARLKVIASASRPESATWCKSLGADLTVDHFGDVAAQLKAAGVGAIDYVLIFNDTDQHFRTAAEVVKPQGVICSIVENRGPLPIELLRAKSVTFAWESMFTRPVYQTADMDEQHKVLTDVSRLIDGGQLRSTFARHLGTINAANVLEAHRLIEAGRTVGKLVLEGF